MAVIINIITGFLGVGKTTAILQLIKEKPTNERWVIIVNEIGRVAIDNKVLSNENIEGVEVSEIAGGCLCCSASDNFHEALEVSIKQLKPDRILIEPSGLGYISALHESFQDASIKELIEIRSTICLVDASHINDIRIQNNTVYLEQLKEADVILINKSDITNNETIQNFKHWLTEHIGPKQYIGTTQQGSIEPSLLQLDNTKRLTESPNKPFVHYIDKTNIQLAINSKSAIPTLNQPTLIANKIEGFDAFGLLFHPDNCFVKYKLQLVLSNIKALRLKGIFKTTHGWFLFNRINQHFSVIPTNESNDSRIEIICFDNEMLKKDIITKEITQCLENTQLT